MNIQNIITKRRGDLMKDYTFHDSEPELMINIFPDKEKISEYILKDPVQKSVQCGPRFAEHEVLKKCILLFLIFAV